MAPPNGSATRRAPLPARCIYVYGIVDAGIHPYLLAGAARRAELELATIGDIAAVHSWIDPCEFDDIEPDLAEGSRLAQLVRRHDDVVTALALAGPLLPVRLGTLVDDGDALRDMLRRSEQQLVAALDRVRGRAEWDLRVTLPGPGAAGPEPQPVDEPAFAHSRSGSGTAYLLGRREARRRTVELRESALASASVLDECLASFADQVSGSGLATGSCVLSRAYLVASDAQDDFVTAAAEGLAGLERLVCTPVLRGPLPPYSFADVRLEGARHD